MSRVVLSRLWYIFPADDQNLRPEQLARKVKSYMRTLSTWEQRAVLEFLVVQYEAFQKQLELLFVHASVTDQEYHERSGRLACYLDHLHAFRRSLDQGNGGEIPQTVVAAVGEGAAGDSVREETCAYASRRSDVLGPPRA